MHDPIQKQHSLLVAIDYTKAFDTLNLPILLSSLRSSGIEEVAFSWFKSYLCGRLQRTKYASQLFDTLALDYGVPEGCILSPLLFNLYLNGLLQQVPFDGFVAYADNLTLTVSNDNIQLLFARMQELLNFICSWSTSHGISISTSKCYGMFLDYAAKPHNSPDIQLFMDGKQLQLVSELKILGVTFSQPLNWHNHVSNIRAKITSMTGILQRLGGDLDMKSRQSIVTSFIVPHVFKCMGKLCSDWYVIYQSFPHTVRQIDLSQPRCISKFKYLLCYWHHAIPLKGCKS